MFTEEDKKKCDSTLDKAIKFGEKIGDFIHVNAKGIVRGLIIAGVMVIFGGIFMVIAMLKRSFGQKT
jgi:predicted Co/Zn/Cd cation transporter (cation efflux family)